QSEDHDLGVEDDHEERQAQQGQRPPASVGGCRHRSSPLVPGSPNFANRSGFWKDVMSTIRPRRSSVSTSIAWAESEPSSHEPYTPKPSWPLTRSGTRCHRPGVATPAAARKAPMSSRPRYQLDRGGMDRVASARSSAVIAAMSPRSQASTYRSTM